VTDSSLVDQDATKVFISYRRPDASFPAHWLHQTLIEWFGRERNLTAESLFIDVDTMGLGVVEAKPNQCDSGVTGPSCHDRRPLGHCGP
jgi:hypothetical protein